MAARSRAVTFSFRMPLSDGLRRSFDAAAPDQSGGRADSLLLCSRADLCLLCHEGMQDIAERGPRRFPRRRSPGYAARQTMQVEKTMKPQPRYSPLIHLVSHPSAWHFFSWHAMAILVLAAWALQLARFAFVVVQWRLGNVGREAPRASRSMIDGRVSFIQPAENEAYAASTFLQ
jgi:hypothetical protein